MLARTSPVASIEALLLPLLAPLVGSGLARGEPPEPPGAVAVAGTHAYVAEQDEGLAVYDVSRLSRPRFVTRLTGSERAYSLQIVGGVLYVAAGSSVDVYELKSPASPTRIGRCEVPANDLHVVGRHAYTSSVGRGLGVIDVSNPAEPVRVATCRTRAPTWAVLAGEGHAYVGLGEGGLEVIDVGDPRSPRAIAHCAVEGQVSDLREVDGHLVLASAWTGISVVDVRDPRTPRQVASFPLPDGSPALCLALREREALVGSGFEGRWDVIDLSEPSLPRLRSTGAAGGEVRGFGFTKEGVVVAWYDHRWRSGGLDVVRIDRGEAEAPVLVGRWRDWGAWASRALRVYGPWVVAALVCFLIAFLPPVALLEINRRLSDHRPIRHRCLKAIGLNLLIAGGIAGLLWASVSGKRHGLELAAVLTVLTPILGGALVLAAVLVAWLYRWRR